MANYGIRAYDPNVAKPSKPPVRHSPPRDMTAQEAWLNDLAQTEAFSGLVAIWQQGVDGTYTSFTAMLPDVARMAFVGIAEGE